MRFPQQILSFCLLLSLAASAQSPELWQLHGVGVQKVHGNAASIALGTDKKVQISVGLLSMQVATNQVFDERIIGSQTGNTPSQTARRAQSSLVQGPGIQVNTKKFGSIAFDYFYQAIHHSTGNIDLIFNGVPGSRQLFPSGSYRADAVQSVNFSYAYPIRFKQHTLAVGGTIRRYDWQYHQAVSLLGPSLESVTNQYEVGFQLKSLFSFNQQATGVDWGLIYSIHRKDEPENSFEGEKKWFHPRPEAKWATFGLSFINQGIHQLSQVSPTYFGLNLNRSESDWSGDVGKDILNYNLIADGQRQITMEGGFSPLRHVSAEIFIGNTGWSVGSVWTTLLEFTETAESNAQFLLYPRFQAQKGQISFPMQLNAQNGRWGVGFHAQAGPLVAGMQSINGLFGQKAAHLPALIYMGLSFAQK